MKKNSVIAVLIIYITAILIVGFLGVNLKVYNPIVYVEKIEWLNNEYVEQKDKFAITMYEREDKEKFGVDAKLVYATASLDKPIVFNIKCQAKPANATNTKLDYYMDVKDPSFFEYNGNKGDNTCDITFKKGCGTRLVVTSTDNSNVKYKIDIEIIDLSDY